MTAQTPDRIVIDGEHWNLLSTPLGPLLAELGDRIPTYVMAHTGNFRGYVADWQIADGWLSLEAVTASIQGTNGLVEIVNGAALDGRHLPTLAEWFTGQLRVGRGSMVRYVHADFESRWEHEELIEVTAGRVTERRPLAEVGAMGSAGPYRLHEPLLGDLGGGAFGQVIRATDLDGRSLVAKAARPSGGDGGTEMWFDTPEGRRPVHVPANAFRHASDGRLRVERADGKALEEVLHNEADILTRDAGRLLPLSYGVWPHDPSGTPILVMEELDGRRPSTPDDVVEILRALQSAVDRGTFDAHGDVKIEHVFIGSSGVRLCDPAPRFDDPGRRGFTPLYNPRGRSGPAADVTACATILRYMPDIGSAGWDWCAAVLDSDVVPEWAHHHGRAHVELTASLSRASAPPPGWVVPPLPDTHWVPDGPPTPRPDPSGSLPDTWPTPPSTVLLPSTTRTVYPLVEAVREATTAIEHVRREIESHTRSVKAWEGPPGLTEAIDDLRREVDATVESVVRADVRVARHAALRDATALDDGDLRGWELVLNGMLLLHPSPIEPEVLGGRYAAVWDSADKIALVVRRLERSLAILERAISHVVVGPDRNSRIIGHTIATRLGLPAPVELTSDPVADGTSLLVMFSWSVDPALVAQLEHGRDAILFAYGLDWTHGHTLAPDIVGIEAQVLYPAWDAQMHIEGDPADLHNPDPTRRARVVDVPADDRPAQQIAADLASTEVPLDDADESALRRIIEAVRMIPQHVGGLGGVRGPFVPDGPVRSARFDL